MNRRVPPGSRILLLIIAIGLGVSCAGNPPTPDPNAAHPTQPPVATSLPPALPVASPIPGLQSAGVSPSAAILARPTLPPTFGYQVVHVFPHDPMAFTEGLIFDSGFLYESTGLEGRSSLRKARLATGEVVQSIELPADLFGEGLTLFGDRLIQLTWKSQLGYVYDKATFRLLREFTYPTEGWGLTQDGKDLIMSDGTSTLYFLDPESFERIRQIEVIGADGPVTQLNELEYVRGEIFANIWTTDRIARINPKTGSVIGWIDLTGLLNRQASDPPVDVLNGIAYDAASNRLFVTGKLWPKLFEITLVPPR